MLKKHKRNSLLEKIFKSISTLNIVSIQVRYYSRLALSAVENHSLCKGPVYGLSLKLSLLPSILRYSETLEWLKLDIDDHIKSESHKHMRHINCFYFYSLITFIASIRATQVR